MNTLETLEKRLIELEIKASFADDLLDKLDQVLVRQQGQIELLTQELRTLRQQVRAQEPPGQSSLRDELPPHY